MGDSHPQTALHPAVFHDAENISQSVEPLVLTYWKAKYLLSKFKADTILLGIGHHNIAGNNDLKFTDEQWAYEMFKRSYPIENLESLENHLEIDCLAFYEAIWRKTGFTPRFSSYPLQALGLKPCGLSTPIRARKRLFHPSENLTGKSKPAPIL